jgi:hypothetical protein
MNLQESKALVTSFLKKCNEYADEKLRQYQAELDGASPWQALEIQDKIGHWSAYRAFNEFTIGELETARLDHWFGDPA